jgi:hypothetical protein
MRLQICFDFFFVLRELYLILQLIITSGLNVDQPRKLIITFGLNVHQPRKLIITYGLNVHQPRVRTITIRALKFICIS